MNSEVVSGIMFTLLLTGILTSAFNVQPVKGEPQTAYIIVHALNPERIEIASIEGMNPDCIEIYDGDTLIGYGAHNNETYNKPIAISPGTHNIRVKFNGIELTQNVNLQEGKTNIVTFVFSSTSFDLNSYIYNCELHSFISGSWSGKTDRIDDTERHPYINWWTNTHFEEPADCGRYGSYTGEATLQFSLSETSYDWYNYASYTMNPHGGNGCPDVPAWASDTEPDSGSYSIPSRNPHFNNWFLQYTVDGNVRFHVGDILLNSSGILLINADSDSTLRVVIDEHFHVWGGAPETREDGGSGTFDTKMSSVPYDLTGTGIRYAQEGWIYVPQDYPIIQEAIDAAEPGDTVVIAPGVYHEQLVINKKLTILGQKGSQTTFEGSGSGIAVTLLPGASGSTIAGIAITNWDQGVLVVNSINCTIYDNIFSLTASGGVAVQGSNAANNTIYSNIFQNNAIAVNLTASSTNSIIYNNCITENEVGIDVSNSNNNIIYHNNFANNIEDPRSVESFNVWDNGIQGNYWSGYNSPDGNMDKIGDDPYDIDEDNVDRYPLIYPYEFYEPSYSPKPDIDKDGKISIIDVATVAMAFGSKPGDENWNSLADMDINETISIIDVARVALHFGEEREDS